MRKAMKFLHTLGSSGVVGGLLAYMIVLSFSPQDTPARYADMRETIALLSNRVLLPSLAAVLVTGLLSIASHPPFQEMRWVWVKAALGISMFEGTLMVIQGKANEGAEISRRIADGSLKPEMLDDVITSEWKVLGIIMAISVANIVLAVWRPSLKGRWA